MSTTLLVVEECLIHRLPLIGWPVVDPNHKLSFIGAVFIGMVLKSHPQAFSLSMAVSQSQLFTINLFPNVEGNTPSLPSLSIPSEELVALYSSVAVV